MTFYGYNEHGHFTGEIVDTDKNDLSKGYTPHEPPECPDYYYPVFDEAEGSWGIECYALVAMSDPDWLIETYFWLELWEMETDGLATDRDCHPSDEHELGTTGDSWGQ